jgi:5-methylcytosine-specific restriction enzyme A
VPWQDSNGDPAKRRQDGQRYRDPEYLANRALVLRRAGGRCEQCGKATRRLQVDHIMPLSVRVDHSLGNLQALCSGPGSCHARKSSAEGRAAQRGKPKRPAPTPRTQW